MTSRREFLRSLGSGAAGAATVGSVLGLAGCGYRPGGGDVRWEVENLRAFYMADDVAASGERLFTFARSVRDFDHESGRWFSGGRVAANATDGSHYAWTGQFDQPLTAYATGAGGTAVAATQGIVARFGPDGEEWRGAVGYAPVALAVAADRVYVVADEGELVAAADGEVRWRRDLPTNGEPRLAALSDGVAALVGDTVLRFGRDGTREWTRDVQHAGALARASSSLVVTARSATTGLDPVTGDRLWSVDGFDGSVRPVVTGDRIYGVEREGLLAYDRSGERRWTFASPRIGGVAADDREVFVATGTELSSLAPADGDVRWRVDHGDLRAGPFVVDDGVLVVRSDDLVCHHR